MKLRLLIITITIFGLTGCSISKTEPTSLNHNEITKSTINTDLPLENNELNTDEVAVTTEIDASQSEMEDATNTDGDTDVSSSNIDLNTDNTQLSTSNQQPITITQSDITHYHDLITDVSSINLSIDLNDPKLILLVNHLRAYRYNFTLKQIGEVTNPNALYTLANKLNHLPDDYVPEDLVEPNVKFSFDTPDEKRNLRSSAAHALESMFNAAKDNDLDLFAVSGYRSYARQQSIYNNKVDSVGVDAADRVSARPGHSEHQSGLAMDISCSSIGYGLEYAFGSTPEGEWVAAHAHEYGFIIRYQEDKTDITGYNYEPWHLRYIGKDVASYIYQHKITIEELYSSILNQL